MKHFFLFLLFFMGKIQTAEESSLIKEPTKNKGSIIKLKKWNNLEREKHKKEECERLKIKKSLTAQTYKNLEKVIPFEVLRQMQRQLEAYQEKN